MSEAALIRTIEARERERCEALERADLKALEELLAETLVHVHTSGRAEDRATYLAGIRQRYRFFGVHRESYDVRSFGDGALAWGSLSQTLSVEGKAPVTLHAFTTQAWKQEAGTWRLAAFHATRQS